MRTCYDYLRWTLGSVLLLLLLATNSFAQGWFGVRNETGNTIIIQETFGPGKMGKSLRIFNNETVKDSSVQATGVRSFVIYDATNPDRPIATHSFQCPGATNNVMHVIKSDGKGGLKFESATSPAVQPKKKN